jgi:sporulation integral membrane protein YlbJ
LSKKYIIALGIAIMIFTLLLSPDICIYAAKEGLLLWFNKILPSLLPFIILINILSGIDIMKNISALAHPITRKIWNLPGSSLLAFIMGFIAGYPMGAKMVRQLLNQHIISPNEAQKILCFSNNCGPLFIVGTVGTLMLNNSSIGYFLLFIHVLSALLLSIIFASYKIPPPTRQHKLTQCTEPVFTNFSSLLNSAITNAMDTIVHIGGYIIFFSVIAHIINRSPIMRYILHSDLMGNMPEVISVGTITGLLELSNGTSILSSSPPPTLYSIALLSGLIGFGGLCVHFQTSYVLGDCHFSLFPYMIAKGMQGILSFILSCVFLPFFSMYTLKTYLPLKSLWLFVLVLCIAVFIYIIKALNHLQHRKYNTIPKVNYHCN